MIQKKILNTIRKFNLLSSLDKVLVGVSGGPDSTALLYLLNSLKVKLGIKILVAHFNHGLRGRDSDLDEKFVRDTAGKLGLEFFSRKIKWQKKSGHPSEESLRKLRYKFLFTVAGDCGVNKIALAHNLDDQAETVLMRLVRGTGLYGLISILPKRNVDSFVIVRPLIEVKRCEIEEYLRKIKVKARIDKTNLKEDFLRNKLRLGILRELSKINPNIKETLARFAQQAASDYDYLYDKAAAFVDLNSPNLIKVSLDKFIRLHTALKRMAVRIALEKLSGDLRTFTNRHWEEIQDLTANRPCGATVNLTKDISVKKDKKYLIIYREKQK
jgi:tRNA(Ile)-lysidine synthase